MFSYKSKISTIKNRSFKHHNFKEIQVQDGLILPHKTRRKTSPDVLATWTIGFCDRNRFYLKSEGWDPFASWHKRYMCDSYDRLTLLIARSLLTLSQALCLFLYVTNFFAIGKLMLQLIIWSQLDTYLHIHEYAVSNRFVNS